MIDIKQLAFGYGKRESLFEGLDLRIDRGGIYGLLGRNGAGKSTLLKLVTGCLAPDAGRVEVFGREAFARDPEVLRRLYFLAEQVYLPARSWPQLVSAYAGFYPHFDADGFRLRLKQLDVPTDRKLTQLSLGQKKKGLIAFALACNTELLVLDEPTNGLDIPSKAQLRSLLAEAMSETRAIVVSTHQVRDLTGLIDPVLVVDRGRVLAQLDLAEVGERLRFTLEPTLQAPTDALYFQRVPGGHYVIRPNVEGAHTEPDLEVLFNAIVQAGSPVLERLTAPDPQTLPA